MEFIDRNFRRKCKIKLKLRVIVNDDRAWIAGDTSFSNVSSKNDIKHGIKYTIKRLGEVMESEHPHLIVGNLKMRWDKDTEKHTIALNRIHYKKV